MICAVITIILSIVTYCGHPWMFIGAAIALVLTVVEFIIEIVTGGILNNIALAVSAIVLGIIALVMGVIAVIIGVSNIGSGSSILLGAITGLLPLVW